MNDGSNSNNSKDLKSLTKGKSAASDLLKPKPKEPEYTYRGGGTYDYGGSTYGDRWWEKEPGFYSANRTGSITSHRHTNFHDSTDDLFRDPLDGPKTAADTMELKYKEFSDIVQAGVMAAVEKLEELNVKITATQMSILRGTIERAVKQGQFMTAEGELMHIRVR